MHRPFTWTLLADVGVWVAYTESWVVYDFAVKVSGWNIIGDSCHSFFDLVPHAR